MKPACFALLLLFCTTFVVAAQEDIPAGYQELASPDHPELKRISEHIRLTQTYQADFEQQRHMAMFLDVLKSTGRIYFQMPDKLRWETNNPYVSLLISNGGHVARFVEENKRLRKLDPGMEEMFQQIVEEMTGIMRGDFHALFSGYRILLSQSGTQLLLLPRSKDLQHSIASLEFQLEKQTGRVERVIIREPQKDYIEISFYNVKENPVLDPSVFSLQSPLAPQKP